MTPHTQLGAARAVLALLPLRERRKFVVLGLVQAVLGLLDLAGIFLLAALTALVLQGLSPGGRRVLPTWVHFSQSPSQEVLLFGGGAATLLLGKSLLAMWLQRRSLRFLAAREAYVGTALARALLAAPLPVMRSEPNYVNAWAVTGGLTALLPQMLGSMLTAFADMVLLLLLAGSLLVVNPVMTVLTGLYFACVGALLHRYLARRATAAGARATQAGNDSVRAIAEAQMGYRELTVLHRRDHYLDRFAELRSTSAQTGATLQFLAFVPKAVVEVVLVLGMVLLAAGSAGSGASGTTLLAVFVAASSRILPAVVRLQSSSTVIRQAIATTGPVFDLIDRLRAVSVARGFIAAGERAEVGRWYQPEDAPPPTGSYPGFTGAIRLDRVSYAYEDAERAAVVDVSLEVVPGQHVALVGPSGAGKSTLLDLILGILAPDSGTVEVAGVAPVDAIHRWPGALAYVPQLTLLINGTVADNVALGLAPRDQDHEAISRALSMAQLDDFVRELPQGLDTRLGEAATGLSGGQLQRLGLARALYSRPRLLLLDEATSSLDADTESLVTHALSGLRGEVTTLTVAHRWATVRHADRIFYVRDGRVAASGSFDELMTALPEFAQQAALMGMQAGSQSAPVTHASPPG